jgi:hypothetical protein
VAGLPRATFTPDGVGATTRNDRDSMPTLPRPSRAWTYTFHTPSRSGARTVNGPPPVNDAGTSAPALSMYLLLSRMS